MDSQVAIANLYIKSLRDSVAFSALPDAPVLPVAAIRHRLSAVPGRLIVHRGAGSPRWARPSKLRARRTLAFRPE